MLEPDGCGPLPRAPGGPAGAVVTCGWKQCTLSLGSWGRSHLRSPSRPSAVFPTPPLCGRHCSSQMPEALAWKGRTPTEVSSSFSPPIIQVLFQHRANVFPGETGHGKLASSSLNHMERSRGHAEQPGLGELCSQFTCIRLLRLEGASQHQVLWACRFNSST